MAYKSLLVALALMGSSLASAATLSPAAFGTATALFDVRMTHDWTCGAPRPGIVSTGSGSSGSIGFGGSNPVFENRATAEFSLPATGSGATATLGFTAYQEFSGPFTVCVHGYKGNGTVNAADFQQADATLLGTVTLGFEASRSFALDISDFLAEFAAGEFLGVQFSLDMLEDNFGEISNVSLTIGEPADVPEPGALALLGTGLLLLGTRRRLAR